MYGTLGAQIRHYRRLREMTQAELAKAVGYQTKASINKIEKNQSTVPYDRLKKIASALRVPISQLLTGDNPPPPTNISTKEIPDPSSYDVVFHKKNNDFIETLYSRNDKIGKAFKEFAAVVLNEEQENQLSPSENILIDKYRTLNASSKQLILSMLDTLIKQQNAPTANGEGES